jgi:hypothetical protein
MKTLKYWVTPFRVLNTKRKKIQTNKKTKRKSNFREKKSRKVYKGGVFTPRYTTPGQEPDLIIYNIGDIIRDIDLGTTDKIIFQPLFPDSLTELITFYKMPIASFNWCPKILIKRF